MKVTNGSVPPNTMEIQPRVYANNGTLCMPLTAWYPNPGQDLQFGDGSDAITTCTGAALFFAWDQGRGKQADGSWGPAYLSGQTSAVGR
jgi:hypothetical protein